jgi:hypothetical protein
MTLHVICRSGLNDWEEWRMREVSRIRGARMGLYLAVSRVALAY